MSFLAPLFLIGALTVALPVVFHLVRRSSREQLPFSSLLFLQASPPRVTRRSRLDDILLLLLRCLVICLLALGFARPFWQKPILAEQPRETGRKIILLLDTSASMRREGLWAAALAKAGEVLRKTSPADQVAIFSFDRGIRPLLGLEQWSAMKAGERVAFATESLGAIKPGWASTHLGKALITAAEAFTEADKQGQSLGTRQIMLISDLQEGSRLEGLQGYDWPRGIEIQVETVKPRRPTNAGLQWLTDSDETSRTDSDPGIRVRVGNSANAQREQFQIRWEGAPGAAPLDVYVPPGQNRIVPAPKLPANSVEGRLALTGDDDDFDNSVYVVQPRVENIKIIFLGDDAKKIPPTPCITSNAPFNRTVGRPSKSRRTRPRIPCRPTRWGKRAC